MNKPNDAKLSLRIPRDMRAQIAEVAAAFRIAPACEADVARAALAIGLDRLAAELHANAGATRDR